MNEELEHAINFQRKQDDRFGSIWDPMTDIFKKEMRLFTATWSPLKINGSVEEWYRTWPRFTDEETLKFAKANLHLSDNHKILNRLPKVGDEVVTRGRPPFGQGKVKSVNIDSKTALINFPRTNGGEKENDPEYEWIFREFEQTLRYEELAVIVWRSSDEEVLENAPNGFDRIAKRIPKVGDKIVTKIYFDDWFPCSFGKVLSVDTENKTAFIELALDTKRNFSYEDEEFIIVEKQSLTNDISDLEINIPEPYTTIVQRDPREFDEVITKIQLGRNLPNNIGKVIDVDLRNKTAIVSMGPNDSFIMSYKRWEEFAILA